MRSLIALKMVIHDRSSTIGSLLGVVAIVFLVGQQLSIFFGLLNYMSVLVDHGNADLWVMSENIRNADSGNFISGRYIDRIIGLPEVDWAEPILIGNGLFRTPNGSYENVRVVGTKRPKLFMGPWQFEKSDERVLLDLESITVDSLDLDKLGNPPIDYITEINGKRVIVRGITKGARGFQGTLIFAPLEKVRDIAKIPPGRYSAILVKLKDVNKEEAIKKIRTILPKCSVYSKEELSKMTKIYYITNTGIGGSFGFSTMIAVLIGVVIITLTMYTSILGRTKDFAVIRAIGGRRKDIAVIIISEIAIIVISGVIIGFAILATYLNFTRNVEIPNYFPIFVIPALALGTIVVSFLGGLIALRVALKADPASVFH